MSLESARNERNKEEKERKETRETRNSPICCETHYRFPVADHFFGEKGKGRSSSVLPREHDNETLSPFWSLNYDPAIRRKKYHLTTATLLVTINPLEPKRDQRSCSRIGHTFCSSFLPRCVVSFTSAGCSSILVPYRNEPKKIDPVMLVTDRLIINRLAGDSRCEFNYVTSCLRSSLSNNILDITWHQRQESTLRRIGRIERTSSYCRLPRHYETFKRILQLVL